MGLTSIVYDVLDDYIVHTTLNKFTASERSAALEHMKNLDALNLFDDSIVIFDRGYYSENFFRYCVDNHHLCLIRLKEKIKISRTCHGDTIHTLKGDPKLNTQDIPIRVIEVTLDNGSKEYLGTNIFDESFTADMFRELYFLRWPVELKYNELKNRLALEEFNGATTTSIFQEFYINMLLANLTSLIKNEVDDKINASANPANKYRYQANRSFVIGRLKKMLPKIFCEMKDIHSIDILFDEALLRKSQIQPNRKYKRKRNKGRTHFNNKKVAF